MLPAHRTAAIQAAMANRPEVALAVLVHQLVLKVFSIRHAETPVKISIEQAYLKIDAENIEQGRAAIVLAQKRQYWQERIEAGKQGGKTSYERLVEKMLHFLFCVFSRSYNIPSSRQLRMFARLLWFYAAGNILLIRAPVSS
jgi:ParB family chromosome partitioning protein